MKTRIIAAFPGCGKSQCAKNHPELKILDSDSSKFSWININLEKKRNFDFPNNYIKHIKNCIGKYDIIFVSTHKVVREALEKENIPYILVCPKLSDKQEYLERYKNRGDSDSFIKTMDEPWEEWLNEIHEIYGEKPFYISSGRYINDELEYFMSI